MNQEPKETLYFSQSKRQQTQSKVLQVEKNTHFEPKAKASSVIFNSDISHTARLK